MNRYKVYIAGPITLGDRNLNLHQSLKAQKNLMEIGFAPMNPMLSMLVPFADDFSHDTWMACCLPWVEACDCVLRLPGESKGADMETAHAEDCGIPVFHSIFELTEAFPVR